MINPITALSKMNSSTSDILINATISLGTLVGIVCIYKVCHYLGRNDLDMPLRTLEGRATIYQQIEEEV